LFETVVGGENEKRVKEGEASPTPTSLPAAAAAADALPGY